MTNITHKKAPVKGHLIIRVTPNAPFSVVTLSIPFGWFYDSFVSRYGCVFQAFRGGRMIHAVGLFARVQL
jgi:hypothetical protein